MEWQITRFCVYLKHPYINQSSSIDLSSVRKWESSRLYRAASIWYTMEQPSSIFLMDWWTYHGKQEKLNLQQMKLKSHGYRRHRKHAILIYMYVNMTLKQNFCQSIKKNMSAFYGLKSSSSHKRNLSFWIIAKSHFLTHPSLFCHEGYLFSMKVICFSKLSNFNFLFLKWLHDKQQFQTSLRF